MIDGLNEVTVETREKIRRFTDEYPKAHVLLTTQPIQWKRPPRARTFQLLKLSDDRILRFLESRFDGFPAPRPMEESQYKTKCKGYIEEVLSQEPSDEERSAARLVLSNPMDLSTVARMLLECRPPTLAKLHQQQFEQVQAAYLHTHPGQEFPLASFSEDVYEKRLRDDSTFDSERFFEVIQVMVQYKMSLEQNYVDVKGQPTRKWIFRHDKIRDYFLMQAIVNRQDERLMHHIDDPRFRGVYLMLAGELPLSQAVALRDALVDRAAETRDHNLSDAVVQLLKTRKLARAADQNSSPPIEWFTNKKRYHPKIGLGEAGAR